MASQKARQKQVDTITLPDYLASALVNGDCSGLDPEGLAVLDNVLANHIPAGWYVVDVARDENGEGLEPRFTWSYRLYGGACSGGSVLDYVIHKVG